MYGSCEKYLLEPICMCYEFYHVYPLLIHKRQDHATLEMIVAQLMFIYVYDWPTTPLVHMHAELVSLNENTPSFKHVFMV